MIKATKHKVSYHETDCMKCVHHSNYIRWFEDARTDYFEQIGLPYDMIEADGFMAPVVSVTCEYKDMTCYGESVYICTTLTQYNGVGFVFCYEVYGEKDGRLKAMGQTKLCLIDKDKNVVNIKKRLPSYHEHFCAAIGQCARIPNA